MEKQALPFDLHVLGMPPALILSQDQTLNIKSFIPLFLFCSVFKDLVFCALLDTLYYYIKIYLLCQEKDTFFQKYFLKLFFNTFK